MKLQNLELVEMISKNEKFIYVYAVLAKSFFRKKIIKLSFESELPHYWWSEIQRTMINNKIFFENLVENKNIVLDIGTLSFDYFDGNDLKKYGDSVNAWKDLKKIAIETQMKFCKEYDSKYGIPDLSRP